VNSVAPKLEITFGRDVKNSFKSMKWYEWVMAAAMVAIAGYYMIAAFVKPTEGGNPGWLTVVNFVSAICGIVCVFFTAKASTANFVFGAVNTVVYIVYLAYWKIYGTMCLELIVYMPMNFVSWAIWAKHKDEREHQLTKSRKLTWWQDLIALAFVAGVTMAFKYWLLPIMNSDEDVAWLDAVTVAIGVVAVFLEAFRFREQYVLWLVTDVIAVAMYIIHLDPVYLTKKSIYLVMAVIGLINWIRLNKDRNKSNE
jgi:nicotinamide mononucleotide transporter